MAEQKIDLDQALLLSCKNILNNQAGRADPYEMPADARWVYWDGVFGDALRVLLCAADSAGAWLWFKATIESESLDLGSASLGDISRAMILYKMQELNRVERNSRNVTYDV